MVTALTAISDFIEPPRLGGKKALCFYELKRSHFAQSGSPDPDQNGDLTIPLEHFVID